MAERILVVDDDAGVRKAFALALEESGFALDTAAGGEEAFKRLKEHRYDLVCLDLRMPGMNGLEVLRQLRRLDPEVPVYIVTAFYEEYMTELRRAAAQGLRFEVLRKPLGAREIAEAAEAVLRPGQARFAAPGQSVGPSGSAPGPPSFRLYRFPGAVKQAAEEAAAVEAALRRCCPGGFHLEVVDVSREPERALRDGVLATPTLLRTAPPPQRRVVGVLADAASLAAAFGLPVPEAGETRGGPE